MEYLYNIDDAFVILNKKKKIVNLLTFFAFVVLGVIILLTSLSVSYFIMFVDVLLATAYLWCLFTYYFYLRKVYNESYHFLAKVEQYEHEIIEGNIAYIEKEVNTIKGMEVYTLKVNHRIIYIEQNKYPTEFCDGTFIKVEVVDNFVIGYEVLENA